MLRQGKGFRIDYSKITIQPFNYKSYGTKNSC